jgi:5'-AMP-activated protein kinase regulatory beta subunit
VRLVPDGEASNANNPERAPRRPVAASEEETVFITIIDLPPGTYSYDFMVDGKVCLAADQPIVNSRNSITVVSSENYSKPSNVNQDEEGWGQEIPDLSENPAALSPQKTPARKSRNQGPVELPAHLERALLNSQPVADDPSMLPLPHHVMLNHLYSRPSLYNTYILGLTVRHRENFVTVVIYKPTEHTSP